MLSCKYVNTSAGSSGICVLTVLLIWDHRTQHPAGFIPQAARTVSVRKVMMKREMGETEPVLI